MTEQGIIDRAQSLNESAGDKEKLAEFCNIRTKDKADSAWKALQTLFKANSKEELVQLLGFSKEDVSKQVEEAIKKFPSMQVEDAQEQASPLAGDETIEASDDKDGAATPTKAESTTSQAGDEANSSSSLFSDDAPGTPGGSAADFFSSMAAGTLRNPRLDDIVPHKPQGAESSVGATMGGSRASSVRSEVIKDNTFHIYPAGESEVDKLITQALVLGDFASAVELCLASERFADALLLAVRGGPELLQSTQKAYFARRTTSLPFLRVFQSIVTEDLADIVQNADLSEWKVIFVVLCTFAKPSDFNNLADQLGQRLQYKWQMQSTADSSEAKSSAKAAREDATLCYLAARRLEKVVGIWIDELREEEQSSSESRYTAHAQALQSFIEKVSVFTAATGYVDEDLSNPTESAEAAQAGARTYKLAGLYDRYYEYADLLATQGLVEIAAKYVQKTPSDYKGTGVAGSELDKARDRLFRAAGITGSLAARGNAIASSSKSSARPPVPSAYAPAAASFVPTPAPAVSNQYGAPSTSYQPSQPSQAPQQPSQTYGGYGASNAYAPPPSLQATNASPYAPSGGYGGPEPQSHGYGVPSNNPYGAPPSQAPLAPPPRAGQLANGASATPPPIPAAQRRDMPGWNDAPSLAGPPKRPASAARETPKPAAIMSPFPMSQEQSMNQGYQQNIHGNTPPPPRASQPGMLPPPPKGGPRPPSAQAVARNAQTASPAQQARPPPTQTAGPPPGQFGGPSPGQLGGPSPSQLAGPPPPRGPSRGGPPPPGVMAGPPPARALSPLGPHGRSTPLTASLQGGPRPPSRNATGSFAPPPPPQSALSPPSARRPSIQQPIQPERSPASTPAPSPAAPSKPTHRGSY